MDDSSPPLSTEAKTLKEAYDALNRNDIPGFLRIFDPQVERVEPSGFPGSGTYLGLDALKAIVELNRGKWAEGGCHVEGFVTAGDRIVVLVHVRVRLRDETEWREGHVGDAFIFRNGKVVYFRTFVDREEAVSWAGVVPRQVP
ncbi:hypothetical protein GC173_15765 [bacterium]|nr:hypothetical protein [bacterium]